MPILGRKNSLHNPDGPENLRSRGHKLGPVLKLKAASARWFVLTITILMMICGGGFLPAGAPPVGPANQEAVIEGWTRGLSAEVLSEKIGCLECHGPDNELGPTFRDIAARYEGDDNAREKLVRVVKQGGKGNWTVVSRGMPMPRYTGRLSDAQIQRLVVWVLDR